MSKRLTFHWFWLLTAVVSASFTFTDWAGITGDGRPAYAFFTSWAVWSGFVVAIAHASAAVCDETEGKAERSYPAPLLTFCSCCALFITAFVILLGCVFFSSKVRFFTTSGIFKHAILPFFAVVDALVNAPKGAFKKAYVAFSFVLPIAYWIATVSRMAAARARFGGAIPPSLRGAYYPYPFTNLDEGWTYLTLALALAFFAAVSIVFAVRLVRGNQRRKGKKSSQSSLS